MRERYIDIVKGLSILCIVFQHYVHNIVPNTINIFMGSFMITAFYVISGWLSAMCPFQRTLKEVIKHRWRQLGIPYLWWTLIILGFDVILWIFGYYDIKYIGTQIYKTITLRGIGTLWFLPALFGGEIIWSWLKKQGNLKLILLIIVISLLYKYLYSIFIAEKTETIYRIIDAPFRTLYNVLGAWIGIAFGFYSYNFLKNNILNSSKLKQLFLGLIICLFSFLAANYLPDILSPLWSLISPLFCPIGLLLIAKSLQNFSFLNFFEYWGKNSLNLMVTHYSIVLVLFVIFIEKGLGISFDGWITLLCFFASLPFQYLLVMIVNKYAGFTLGK